MKWEKELDEKFGDFYATGWGGEKCYCNNAVKQFISTQIAKAKQEERKKIQKLIVDEMLICHKEGTPTSRLTSLSCNLLT